MPSTDPASSRRRATLATQAAAAMGVVALVAVLLAGAVALPLVGQAAENQARRQLAASADLVATTANRQNAVLRANGLSKLRQLLGSQQIELLILTRKVAAELPDADVEAVADGRTVSGTRTIGGRRSLLEARPTDLGSGIALVQPLSAVSSPRHQAVRRMLLALAVGLGGGALAGLGLAWRLARPLRRASAAAQQLAAGHREIRVEPEGPAEMAEVAESLNDLAAALGRSEGRQREFLLSVSHELRTPLTAVRGYAEALADGVIPPERTAATGATMLGEAERLTRLVDDLLDLARLGADSFPLQTARLDLVALLGSAATVWRDRCAAAGVELVVETPPGGRPIGVRADAARVRQVIDGLAENALRMLEPGGRLVLAVRAEGGRTALAVRDSGPGLTDTDIGVAFDRSALADRYRGERRVGTGIGLALIDELVRRMGGTVLAGHAPEGGAAFTVSFPVVPD
jgi:two-component system sensor histidine kinase BaeS